MVEYNLDDFYIDGDGDPMNYSNYDYLNRDLVKRGKGVSFERVRRITGYLVGTLERFGDGKKAEEADRVKHF